MNIKFKKFFSVIFTFAGTAALIIGIKHIPVAFSTGTTWYIRSDGGTDTQCTGQADAAYPGSGTAQACAYSHPYYLTGWYYDGSGATHGTMHMSGSDTVIFSKSGDSFKIGYDAAWTGCDPSSFPYECYPQPFPSGSAGATTKIYGYGGNTGATTINTYLWGTRGVGQVLYLGGSGSATAKNYIDFYNIDVSDHILCEKGGTAPPTTCNTTDDYAQDGVGGKGNDHISLHYINIHGVARYGIQDPGASNWTYDHITVKNNGYGGLSFDDGLGTGENVTGTMIMSRSSILYSGCGETYPGLATADCWGQDNSHGGYGDGIGFATVSGGTTIGQWTMTDNVIAYSTQDGFDGKHGKHCADGSCTDYLHSARNLYEGNVGQQMKMEAPLTSENDFFIGDCNYFNGQSFTFSGFGITDYCRANGNTFELGVTADEVHKITGATIYSVGDVAILTSTDSANNTCNGNTKVVLRNSMVLNGRQWNDDTTNNGAGGNDTAAFYYASAADGNGTGACGTSAPIDEDYNQIFGTKVGAGDVTGSHSRYGDPLIIGPLSKGPTTYSNSNNLYNNFYLSSLSPSRYAVTGSNSADTTVAFLSTSNIDFNSYPRGTNWDGGAVQFGSTSTTPHTSTGSYTISGKGLFQ